MPRGSFNLIRWTDNGRQDVVRRITLQEAIRLAEEHSRQSDFYLGSVRRLPNGDFVGQAIRGVFTFA
jgi:hypothetical protein